MIQRWEKMIQILENKRYKDKKIKWYINEKIKQYKNDTNILVHNDPCEENKMI